MRPAAATAHDSRQVRTLRNLEIASSLPSFAVEHVQASWITLRPRIGSAPLEGLCGTVPVAASRTDLATVFALEPRGVVASGCDRSRRR